jgi:hypothetical protein
LCVTRCLIEKETMDRRFELIKLAAKESNMWEVNNPRVIKILTMIMKLVEEDETLDESQIEQIFFYINVTTKLWGREDMTVDIYDK